jgi:hypothetical protein
MSHACSRFFSSPGALVVVDHGCEHSARTFARFLERKPRWEQLRHGSVLHGDDGNPAALIRLDDLMIVDYTTSPKSLRHCDAEHEELVREFREEYFDQMSEMEDGAFAAGIIFPAIPINLTSGLGVDIVLDYINLLPSSS